MKPLALGVALTLALGTAAFAQILNPVTPLYNGAPLSPANGLPTAGAFPGMVAGSTLTRAANTTTYTANTTACANRATTTCVPITIAIATANGGKGIINRVTLLKSSGTLTNANFNVWFFSAAPGVASPAQYDNVSYTGPRAGDMPNYLGSASCTSPTATSDATPQTWFECALNNPNTGGAIEFQALVGSTSINAFISVTAAYVPTSQETFNVYVGGIY